MPTNNGKPWNARLQDLEHERSPRPDERSKNDAASVRAGSMAASVTPRSKPRASRYDTDWIADVFVLGVIGLVLVAVFS